MITSGERTYEGKRLCNKCGKFFPLTDEFWMRDSSKGSGFRSGCKVCRSRELRLRRSKEDGYYVRDVVTKREKIRLVRQFKEAHPCMDCGLYFRHYVLDFDHRPGEEKLMGISLMLTNAFSWVEIQAEMDKCDLVCANCHRERTYGRIREQYPDSDRVGC
jgi:hypothetical protein